MRPLKDFSDFVKKGTVKKITPNKERAESLARESDRKTRSMNESLEKIGVRDDNANDYVEHCYDIIMYLVRAKLYYIEYNADGKGSHEAEVSYLSVLGFDEKDVGFIDQLRYFRNGILYYGSTLDAEYANKVIKFTKQICARLKQSIEESKDLNFQKKH